LAGQEGPLLVLECVLFEVDGMNLASHGGKRKSAERVRVRWLGRCRRHEGRRTGSRMAWVVRRIVDVEPLGPWCDLQCRSAWIQRRHRSAGTVTVEAFADTSKA